VKIITWANTEAQPVRAYCDHAVFETTTIFRDGFESGTTSAWSSP